MQYMFNCKKCGFHTTKNLQIKERDDTVSCEQCHAKMIRVMSAPSVNVQMGCLNAAKRDGVGCMVNERGQVCPPKTRGSKETRKRLNKKT